jgi:hypothetical protein
VALLAEKTNKPSIPELWSQMAKTGEQQHYLDAANAEKKTFEAHKTKFPQLYDTPNHEKKPLENLDGDHDEMLEKLVNYVVEIDEKIKKYEMKMDKKIKTFHKTYDKEKGQRVYE